MAKKTNEKPTVPSVPNNKSTVPSVPLPPFSVYAIRNGKCIERFYDTLEKCVKYIERYIGKIKDFLIYPNFTPYEEMISIELENGRLVKIYTPKGKADQIHLILFAIAFVKIMNQKEGYNNG